MAEPDSTLPTAWWTALAMFAGGTVVVALVAGQHYTASVRLGEGRTVLATTVLACLGALACISASIARRNERAGLVGIALVLFATGGFWLLLGRHRFAGPVVLSFGGEHGMHIGDPLALVPVAAGLLVLVRAFRQAPSARPSGP